MDKIDAASPRIASGAKEMPRPWARGIHRANPNRMTDCPIVEKSSLRAPACWIGADTRRACYRLAGSLAGVIVRSGAYRALDSGGARPAMTTHRTRYVKT